MFDSVAPLATQEPADPDSIRSAPSREGAAVLALAMSAFVLNLNANVMGALLPFVRGELGFDSDAGALLISATGAGSAVGALVVADAGRRLGRRAVLGASLGLFVVASVAHLVVSSFWPLLALRAFAGLSTGVAYAAASAAAADLAPYERRGAVMSKFNAGLFLAIPVGLPLTVWLSSVGYWSAVFAVQAAVGLLALGLSLRNVPPLPPTPAARRLALLTNGGVLAVLAATMLHVGSFFTVVQLATSWLDDEGIVAKEQQVWVWVGLGALSVAGSALFGKLSDRVGKRRFVLITSGVLVVCFFALSRAWGPDYLLPIGCVLAVAAAARTGPLQALVSGLVPAEQLGALMGLRGFAMQAGVFLFALGASELTADLGFRGVLVMAAACQVGSYLAIRFGVREPRQA
jgi:DHA1 family inner membrane transport protein